MYREDIHGQNVGKVCRGAGNVKIHKSQIVQEKTISGAEGGLAGCRAHFPALNDPQSIICDGAAGSQVIVIGNSSTLNFF